MYQIRQARLGDETSIARVHVESWKTAYQGIMPQAVLENLSCEDRERGWREILNSLDEQGDVFVAEDADGDMVGFVHGQCANATSEVHTAEVTSIYILGEYRRQGIGTALWRAIVHWLDEQEVSQLRVRVLADNPSCRFYDGLGGRPTPGEATTIGGVEMATINYIWDDWGQLVERLHAT